jgi:RNA 2',3'-cyclic 3'-phosphodiesterase
MSPLGVNRSSRSAVAIVPPESFWEPINAIRQKYDREIVRWMPHINLVFPFVHPDRLEEERESLAAAVADVGPWEVTLGNFRYFKHSSNRASVWLEPQPQAPLEQLHAALVAQFPHLDTDQRFAAGFTPHLTVGQTKTLVLGRRLVDELNEAWQPLTFQVDSLTVLRRNLRAPYEVAYSVELTG